MAGAGKTTTAIRNANEFIAENPGKQNKILMLTLTQTGAREITNRTNGAINGNTMHSFCWKLLRQQYALAHVSAPKILDTDEADRYLLESIVSCCPKNDPEEVSKAIAQIRSGKKTAADFDPDFGKALNMYYNKLENVNGIDFTGIIERAYQEILKPEVYQRYDGMYVMSDETQDCATCSSINLKIIYK